MKKPKMSLFNPSLFFIFIDRAGLKRGISLSRAKNSLADADISAYKVGNNQDNPNLIKDAEERRAQEGEARISQEAMIVEDNPSSVGNKVDLNNFHGIP